MARLKFYDVEDAMFPIERHLNIDTQDHIRQIVNKLVRHFHLPKVNVKFVKNQQRLGRYWASGTITFPFNKKIKTTGLAICHEVGHHFTWSNYRNVRHCKKLLKIMKRMVAYCRKHSYWNWSKWSKGIREVFQKQGGRLLDYAYKKDPKLTMEILARIGSKIEVIPHR